jgi:hypothetical protein
LVLSICGSRCGTARAVLPVHFLLTACAASACAVPRGVLFSVLARLYISVLLRVELHFLLR